MTVVIPAGNELIVPTSVRRKAGMRTGDKVRFTVSGRAISIVPYQDEYTPAERRAVNRGIAQSLKEYREGNAAGPFATAEALVADLHTESARLDAGQRKRAKK